MWEIFLSKNTLTQNIDGSNLFDIFDQSSIFWQLFNILTHLWVKILIENSVLRWTFSQNQSYGNGSIRIKHFQHNEFWSKFWWNVCGQYGVKNLIKNRTSIFCFKILTVFFIEYGSFTWYQMPLHFLENAIIGLRCSIATNNPPAIPHR